MVDKKQLLQFVESIGKTRFEDSRGLQWRVYLIKRYKNTSALVFKFNHVLGDGIGAVLLGCAI
jgi:hypothetical protein